MVGKLVLPLLGGSPAVWNACMVFFQALLLLGYLYADRVTKQESPRKQWYIHMGVLALPVAAFAASVALSGRHTPIAAAESLAPSDGSSAIVSVLLILTLAIGVPFFVVSTSATLLQKWFTYTGHPSARDPYFLYAASNFGSLISLLGYPLFIEPNMTQGAQTWFWAAGFVALVALIVFCGRAAVNPLGVPPAPVGVGAGTLARQAANVGASLAPNAPAKQGGKQQNAVPAPAAPADSSEAAPTWLRMAKWTALAFVPSSLMLGVTFHMTTDIASIPLLWVGPLALYLVTFIIAFGRVPPWFRILIGNLAPVMILLLVFLMISEVNPGVGISLLLYNLTFFAAALMCHYELARDRPSPQYLTTYFLIMSLGGVLGGIFNSLLAPVVFTLAYEFPLALVIACLMVPKLITEEDKAAEKAAAEKAAAERVALQKTAGTATTAAPAPKPAQTRLGGWIEEDDYWIVAVGSPTLGLVGLLVTLPAYQFLHSVLVTGGLVLAFNAIYLLLWRHFWKWYKTRSLDARRTGALVLDVVIPVALGVAFWQMPKLLGSSTWYDNWVKGITEAFTSTRIKLTANTINIVVLYALPVMVCFFFVDRPLRFALAVAAILGPVKIRAESNDAIYTERSFFGILKVQETAHPQYLTNNAKDDYIRDPSGRLYLAGAYHYRKLVHGTTLHGTQVVRQERHVLDDFQLLTAGNVWDNLAVAGAQTAFDARQEPLTYYHRTGPVGAMFAELTRRGKDLEHVAMVGLGTGSVSCYAKKGQKLTFYEIDPVVRRLVEKPTMVMNEKELKERGCAPVPDPEVRQLVEKLGGVTIYDQAGYEEKKRAYIGEERKYQDALRGFFAEYKRCKEAGEPLPERPAEPTKPPAVPEIGPFTYVDLAKRRGADIDFRMGDARLKLKEDTDRKYSLLLVDAFSSDSIPVHLLTVEAVQLYLDRLTDDGILALHISNKYVRLEPVVAAIAEHHKLVARVWNDDTERGPGTFGKTASSWVVLARKREDLGSRLCSPIGDLIDPARDPYGREPLIDVIKKEYPELVTALDKNTNRLRDLKDLKDFKDFKDFKGPKDPKEFKEKEKEQKEVVLDFLAKRPNDPKAQQFASWIRIENSEYITLMKVLQTETGYGFRPLRPVTRNTPLWTDDYADVMRVMMIDELQKVRKFLGLPSLDDDE
jgi:hypothetical protein